MLTYIKDLSVEQGIESLTQEFYIIACSHPKEKQRTDAFSALLTLLPINSVHFQNLALHSCDSEIREQAVKLLDSKKHVYILAQIADQDKSMKVRNVASKKIDFNLFPALAEQTVQDKEFDILIRFEAAKSLGLEMFPRIIKKFIFSEQGSSVEKGESLDYLSDEDLNNIIEGLLRKELTKTFENALIERLQCSLDENHDLIVSYLRRNLSLTEIRRIDPKISRNRFILTSVIETYPFGLTDKRCEEAIKKLGNHWPTENWKSILIEQPEQYRERKRYLGPIAIAHMEKSRANLPILYAMTKHEAAEFRIAAIGRLDPNIAEEFEILKELCMDKSCDVVSYAIEKIAGQNKVGGIFRKILFGIHGKKGGWYQNKSNFVKKVLSLAKPYYFKDEHLIAMLHADRDAEIRKYALKYLNLDDQESQKAMLEYLSKEKFSSYSPHCYLTALENLEKHCDEIELLFSPQEIFTLINDFYHILVYGSNNDAWGCVKTKVCTLLRSLIIATQ